ncbi:MAG: putative transporter-binding protein [Frondihabitans sp.]|nr:putative transporter-binding protein [Frondihabitans sp.]
MIQTAAAVTLAALALTGCGRASTSSSSATTAVGSGPAKGTVTLWAPDGDATALKKTLAPFEKANPDVKIQTTIIPSAQYNTKLQTAIAAGTTPDVAQLYTETAAQFLDPKVFAAVPDGLVDPSSFFSGSWKSGEIKGTAYAVPWYTYTYALIYRKDLAAKAGVAAPKTISEMVPFFKKLQSAGAVKGFGADVGWDSYNGQDIAIYTWQNGGNVINAAQTKWTFANNPAVITSIKEFASFFSSGTANTDTPQFLDAQPYFVSGKTAALQSGPWVISQLDGVAKSTGWTAKNVATVPLPAGSSSGVGPVGGGSWGVFKSSTNQDAAWKVIRYLSEQKTQVAQYKAYGSMPSLISAWKDKSITSQPLLDAFFTQMKNTRSYPTVSTWSQVATEIGKQVEAVARGTETAVQAAQAIQTYADNLGTGSQ